MYLNIQYRTLYIEINIVEIYAETHVTKLKIHTVTFYYDFGSVFTSCGLTEALFEVPLVVAYIILY